MDNREWKVVLSIETQLKRIADVLEESLALKVAIETKHENQGFGNERKRL